MKKTVFLTTVVAICLVTRASAGDDQYAELIGKPAPEIPADFALNGRVVKLANLKGKVVLVNFWSVLCGPCYSTFPHLRRWEKYFCSPDFEMIGVTSYCCKRNGFDKHTGTVTCLIQDQGSEEEQVMLRDFASYHKLRHRLEMATDEESKMIFAAYKISRFPTFALIDKNGVLRMVKVGAGEENFKAIEAEIQKLLDEK